VIGTARSLARSLALGLMASAAFSLVPRVATAQMPGMHMEGMDVAPRTGTRAELCRLLESEPVAVPASGDALAPALARSPYLHLVDDRRRHELVIEVGPADIPAHQMATNSAEIDYQLTYVPFDAWVHGFRVELVDAHGHPVPRRVLHHIDTTRPAARDLFLPVAQRFVALGAETGAVHLPALLVGVPLHRGEPLLVSTMLHNPTNSSYSGVRVRLVLSYTRRRPRVEVAGFRLDVMFPTGPMEFDLPPGRTVRSWEGTPGVRARLLGITGHLHRYAEWMEFDDVTSGRVIWRVRPRTNASGEIARMPVSFPRLGLGWRIDPTHRYRVTASYFNPTARTIPEGAMAKVAGIFASVDPLPPIDVRNAMYQADLRYLLGLRCGSEGMARMLAHVQHGE
jgi:hypothetical protein